MGDGEKQKEILGVGDRYFVELEGKTFGGAKKFNFKLKVVRLCMRLRILS